MIDKIGSRQWQQAKLQDSRNSFFDLKIGPIHQATQIVCANCLCLLFFFKASYHSHTKSDHQYASANP